MQQRGDDRSIIQTHFGQDGGNSNGMGEIGFPRLTELTIMHPLAIIIGQTDQVFVCLGVIVADQRDQVFDIDLRHPVRIQ